MTLMHGCSALYGQQRSRTKLTTVTEGKMNIKCRTTGEASFPRAKTLDMAYMMTKADIEDPATFLITMVTTQ